ncbi:DUF308 domain-containing protein [Candidatus Saccharibacteria bacterium]|nr:DUF308 domain-containing protein [Candidatus Saccharibacteria bacterium]
MSATKRKFIESHWLTFAVKGVVSIIAGLCMMLTVKGDIGYLTKVVGCALIFLGAVEFINVLHRIRRRQNWSFPLALGIIELIVAVCVLFSVNPNLTAEQLIWLRIVLLSCYILFASVLTIAMGFMNFKNMTDRYLWVVNGMLGCIFGFVMLADNGLSATTHIKLFGTYLLVNGLTDLFFGIHSKDEMAELHAERVSRHLIRRNLNKKPAKKEEKK